MTLDERLERLESELAHAKRRNGWLLGAAALAMGVCALVWAISGTGKAGQPQAPAQPQASIRAKEFILVDDNGKTRATLAMTKDGAALSLLDENGKGRVALAESKEGPVLANQASQAEISGVDVQLMLRLNDPKQVVDVERPQPAVFKVTFRGTARAVDALRDYTADHPLRVDWVLNEPYPLRREQQRSAAALLDGLDAIRSRGLTVADVSPPYLEFVVDELVTEPMAVGVKAGSAPVVDLRTEPDRVSVTLRRRDLAQLLPAERVLLLPLEDRLRDAAPGQVLSLPAMRVPDRIRGFAIVGAEPREVSVTLRIEDRQVTRRLAQIPVRLNVSPGFLERYDVKVVDEQEWLVEVEVEGDESKIAALRPSDIKAFVTIPSDLLPQTPLHRADVKFSVPEGITVLSQRSVRLRLTPRESPSP